MKIDSFKAKGFRNLKDIYFEPSEKVNVIYGENAQGKTNLLEAMWLFTGVRSFRGARDREFIGFDEPFTSLEMFFSDSQRQQNAKLTIPRSNIKDKKAYLNGVLQSGTSGFFGTLRCIVFSPDHLSLIKGAPDLRRKFIDTAISQIRVNYLRTLQKYNKILVQRNALLKNSYSNRDLLSTLDMWDLQLAKVGTYISMLRIDYIEKLSAVSKEYYHGMSSGNEKLKIKYLSNAFKGLKDEIKFTDSIIEYYYNKLKSSLENDIRQGFTSVGIHRDDLCCYINGRSARTYGSQGQQRSAALSLKLAEAYLLRHAFCENPVILFDDVLSELDLNRQSFVLNNIDNMQTFITCCDVNNTKQLKSGKIYRMYNGELTEER